MKARFPEKYARIGSDKIMTAAIKSEVRKSAANTVQEQINNSAGRYDTILATRSTTDSASDASGLSIF